MSDSKIQKPKVNFLIVGGQKAGTTALHHMLKQHQDIFLPSRKELHFFDNDTITDWESPDYKRYEGFFNRKKDTQIAGEATPIYSYWPPCMERISRYNPDMKLIVCIRNPADRAFSNWSMECGRQNESMTFSDAIRQGRTRVALGPGSRGGHHRQYSYVERGFYAPQISNILRHFSTCQLLVVTFDDLLSDLNHFLDILCRFLCVPEFSRYPQNRKILPIKPNPNVGSMSKQDRDYLQTLFQEDIKETQYLTGLDLSAWLR